MATRRTWTRASPSTCASAATGQAGFAGTSTSCRRSPRLRVLDIGCGPARLWCDQLARVPQTWQITLADLSPGMIDQARANLAAAGAANDHRFLFRTADAQELPFGDDTFDAVLANHMLYHVPDIPHALQEIRRVLRPAGRLYAAVNGDGHMAELHDLVAPFASGEALPPAPERRFGLENGAEQLARWFVRVERRVYPDSLQVTEAEPLAAYALSISGMLWMPEGEPSADELTRHFEALLARDGVIHIAKSSGLFIAAKLPRPDDVDGDDTTLPAEIE
ncbi:MAG: class I SAM-dependent methyltransferase [Caldilineales bacterium]